LLRENNDQDLYLRHAAVMGLVGTRNFEALATAARSEHRAERLGALLAFRRLERAEIAAFLRDSDPLLVREAALAINDAPIAAALPELAKLLAQPVADEFVMLRAINANFRLGQPENANALAAYAGLADAPELLRAEALAQLAQWPKPPARDRVVGVFRPLAEGQRDAAVARDAVVGVASQLLTAGTSEEVQEAAIDAIQSLEVRNAAELLAGVMRDSSQPETTRAAALRALDKLRDPRLAEWVTLARDSDAPALRLAALPLAARISPEAAAPVLERLVTAGTPEEQKIAYRTLGGFDHPSADELLAAQAKKLATGEVPAAAQLELLEALEKRPSPAIKQLLAERETAINASGDPLAPYLVALEGGNVRRGARIFRSQPVMSCVRCHSAGTGGGDAGPNLAMIGTKHDRKYLLEAVVKPNAHIAPGFDNLVVTLKSGKVVGGTVANETADLLSLRDANGIVVDVKKAEIATREGAPSSMPEIYGAVLTKSELRDVVEFLAALTKAPEDVAGDIPRALRTP
ncbi:MAG TPA: hypothetical protein VEQ65_11140, partial [Opitutus sp.]|nr:hypothetical protein [Opitutus sp.]